MNTGNAALKYLMTLLLVFASTNGGAAPPAGRDHDIAPSDAATALAGAFQRAAEKAGPSVVTIETYSGPRETRQWARRGAQAAASDEAADDDQAEIAGARNGVGTGIVFDKRGYVLTCNHVIAEADLTFVRLADGRRYEVVKTLQDPFTDVAIVQIAPDEPLQPAELAKDDDLQVGDWVVTIGNPYGLGVSVTAGVVSATDRHLRHIPYAGLIQTDAATNPGNSGGAMVDLDGRVVGMNEGGYGVAEGFQGIGFAIPIDIAAEVAEELIAKGRVNRPYLGIETEIVPINIARHLGLETSGGVIVCDVAPRSPADRAGVRVGDVLTHVNSAVVTDHFTLFRLIDETREGESIAITVLRDATSIEIDLVPSFASPPAAKTAQSENVDRKPSGFIDEELGIAVDAFTPESARTLGYRTPGEGLLITHVEPRSIAAKQGICAGMIVVRMDGELVETIADYRQATEKRDLARGTLLLLGTARQKHFVLCGK